LNILRRLEDVTGGSVDCALNIFKRWLECASVTLKVNIYFEEWFENLLWHVSSSADTLLHLVQGVLGGVKKCLIHGPVVVFGQLLDLFG
jgi:hypothetical protein